MGKSYDWQSQVFVQLADLDIDVYNPRRVTAPENIEEQIRWELEAMEKCDMIAMHYEPESKSPVTLMEAGLHMRSGRLVIHCPDGYWRRENVLVTADFYRAKMVSSLDALIQEIRERSSW